MSKDWEKIARQVSLDMAHPLNYECIAQALAAAYRAGEESMREKAAKICDEQKSSESKWLTHYSERQKHRALARDARIGAIIARALGDDIRALPISVEASK